MKLAIYAMTSLCAAFNSMFRLRKQVLVSTIVCACSISAIANGVDIEYETLVKNPNQAKRNAEFKAFLLGIGTLVSYDYICSDNDRKILASPDRMIDSLIEFSKTAKGKMAMEGTLGIGQMVHKHNSGEVLVDMLTGSFRCQRNEKPRRQIYP